PEALEGRGPEQVVLEQELDVGAGSEVEATVPVPRNPQPRGVAVELEARVLHRGDDVEGAVGGAVVDDEQLEVAVRLRENALEGLRDVVATVPGGHADRERRRAHGVSPSARAALRGTRVMRGSTRKSTTPVARCSA